MLSSEEINEVWRTIPEIPDYAMSNMGRLKRLTDSRSWKTGYILSGSINRRGYRQVILYGKSYRVHRLIMWAFVGKCPEGKEVNHKNCIKDDNRLENLEYVTPKENVQHAIRNGRGPGRAPGTRKGMPPTNAKLTVADVRAIRALEGTMTQREIGLKFGVAKSTIWDVLHRRRWANV